MRIIGALVCWAVVIWGQAQVRPVVSQRTVNDQVNIVRLAPRYATAIKLPEAVSSVVVGDPAKFLAEHSDKEPTLVLVKPVTEEVAESNLLVTTTRGRQLSFLLRSEIVAAKAPVDFVVNYRPAGSFLIEESALGGAEVVRTEAVAVPAANQGRTTPERDPLAQLLERQQRARLPELYGVRTTSPDRKGDLVRAGVSEVLDQGQTVAVLFSVINPQSHAVEVLAPQIQLAGKVRKGFPVKRSRWGTSQQLAVKDFRLAARRIGPGERTDGVVVFDRPSFKQSNETLFLQVAESGAVDRPAMAPIGFGVSAVRKESNRGE
jgi:hypothetical protein